MDGGREGVGGLDRLDRRLGREGVGGLDRLDRRLGREGVGGLDRLDQRLGRAVELVDALELGLDAFASLAAKALEPKPELEVSLHHIHAPAVSVREQAALVLDRLRRSGTMTFRALCGDSPDTLTTVARFLSLLELFREGAVAFDQVTPLGELTVRWTGSEDDDFEIDEFEGAPAEAPAAPPQEETT